MIPQRIDPGADRDAICNLGAKWRIQPRLAYQLTIMAQLLPFQLSIISGWRSCEEQEKLEATGRPAAPCELSTHTSCPLATGADLKVDIALTDVVKATVGQAAWRAGLRWGGGGPVEDTGIPLDWNHVDLGARNG